MRDLDSVIYSISGTALRSSSHNSNNTSFLPATAYMSSNPNSNNNNNLDWLQFERLRIIRPHGRGGGTSNEQEGGSTLGSVGETVETFVATANPYVRPAGRTPPYAATAQARQSFDNQPVLVPSSHQAPSCPVRELIDDGSRYHRAPLRDGAQEYPVAQYVDTYIPQPKPTPTPPPPSPRDGQYPVAEQVLYPQDLYPEADVFEIFQRVDI